ncbi:hypothetical protein C8R44DRAFT_746421 [Mycena epipterygia]|nr:hypothetical protein C8R44DRAFT_746421 [Mycena epipterygia]
MSLAAPDIFSTAAPFIADERHHAFNAVHSAIKRVSTTLFRLEVPGLDHELIDACTVRLFAEYNVALVSRDDLPGLVPAYYVNFAQNMNAHDDSGFGWAYIDESSGTIVWDDKLDSPADPASYLVTDDDIYERYLRKDEVAVTSSYVLNAERLILQEQNRQIRYHEERQQKRASKNKAPRAPDVHTMEAKAGFAKKRQALDAAAAAKKANAMQT